MSDQPRPVWLTRDEFMALSYAVDVCNHHDVERIGDTILERWRAAPADPVEAVARAICEQTPGRSWDLMTVSNTTLYRQDAEAALRALGMAS